jgi:DNA-binding transcriptional MerR regulator
MVVAVGLAAGLTHHGRVHDDRVTQQLLPIGRFARLCRLSIKQLPHYDQLGLLRPARVDPSSGYRSHAPEQARSALVIALLRTLEVPLPAIADILSGDAATVSRVLRAEHARVQDELDRRRATLRTLQRLLEEGLGSQEVTLAREPARRLLVVRASCAPEDIGVATSACLARVLAAADKAGVGWAPPVFGLFPLDLEPPVAVAAGIQAQGGAPGLDAEELPGAAVAVTSHLGPYQELPLAYHALFAWVYEQGHQPRGLVREAYLTDPATTDPAQLATRLLVPIDDEEATG